MSDIYDLAILGGGPAGITAAIYASRARLNTIWIDKNFAPGGQVTATYAVDNYPGMPGISGHGSRRSLWGACPETGIGTAAREDTFPGKYFRRDQDDSYKKA